MDYINFIDIPRKWGLNKGDVVFVSSDITQLGAVALENNDSIDINGFIDVILNEIGEEGTLVFPTYNWGFCKGKTFNYLKTKCETGALGMAALKRKDFVRTHHPIYSFAVAGKLQKEFYCLNNISSFGADSPFALFEKYHAQNVIIDVDYTHCFTFTHYLEQKVGVSYRYEKMFTAGYIDKNGQESIRGYSMYVRDLDLDVKNDLTDMGKDMENKGVSKVFIINNVPIKVVSMDKCWPLFREDIINNRSRKLCKYIGQ